MPARHVLIHVGPPKTGTTTIQAFMHRAGTALAEQGVLYPRSGRIAVDQSFRVKRPTGWMTKSGPDFAHHLLPWTLLGEVENTDADEVWRALVHELRSTTLPIAVISSEAFSRLKPEHVRTVRAYLAEFRVSVLSYLRSPASRLLSDYTQRVKTGRCDSTFAEFIRSEVALISDYDDFLTFWDTELGRDRVLIREFESAMATGCLELDFAAHFACDMAPLRPHLETTRRNVSPGFGSISRMRAVNRVEAFFGRRRATRRLFSGVRRLVAAEAIGRLFGGRSANPDLGSDDDRALVDAMAGQRYTELLERARSGPRSALETGGRFAKAIPGSGEERARADAVSDQRYTERRDRKRSGQRSTLEN